MATLLLTSGIQLDSEQLQALSSWTTSQLTPEGSHKPADSSSSGGFLLANSSFCLGSEKSDLDSSETNLTGVVVGRGAAEASSEKPTLYGFLFDLFGESLGLRLAVHETLRKDVSVAQTSEPHPQQAPSNHDIRHVNRSLVQFLSKEGFKPVKVDLPYYLPPPRLMYGERQSWSFSIPRFVLPVRGNALDHRTRKGQMQRQQGLPSNRGRVKMTGVSPSYKRRSHKLGHSSDISSSWL